MVVVFQQAQLKVRSNYIFLWNKDLYLETKAAILNREKKLLHHVAMGAKFLNDNL